MKPMPCCLALLLALAAGTLHAGEEPGPRAKDPTSITFDRFDAELKAALQKPDIPALALLVRFPLRLNHPDGSTTSLDTPRTLQTHFAEAFPPAVRDAIRQTRAGDLINRDIGVGYRDGVIWTEDTGGGEGPPRFRVSVVNLPGSGPKAASDALRLVFVCETDKHRAVVEEGENGKARYRVWNKPRSPLDKPDLEIADGAAGSEGTSACAHSFWTFRTGGTSIVLSEPGCGLGEDAPDDATGDLTVWVGDEVKQRWWCS